MVRFILFTEFYSVSTDRGLFSDFFPTLIYLKLAWFIFIISLISVKLFN